jgi:hypothetical protein
MAKQREFKGNCKGVRLVPRGEKDSHICIQILTEDDDTWFPSPDAFSSYWIDDLIQQLKEARNYMKTYYKKDGAYGYKF